MREINEKEFVARQENKGVAYSDEVAATIMHESCHAAAAYLIGVHVNSISVYGKCDDYGIGWTKAGCHYTASYSHQQAKIGLAPLAVNSMPSRIDLTEYVATEFYPETLLGADEIEKAEQWVATSSKRIRQVAEALFADLFPKLKCGNIRVADPFGEKTVSKLEEGE